MAIGQSEYVFWADLFKNNKIIIIIDREAIAQLHSFNSPFSASKHTFASPYIMTDHKFSNFAI
jgi:hypothetical protein